MAATTTTTTTTATTNGHAPNGASPVDDLPPFPDGLTEAPINRISLRKLLASDAAESERVFAACRGYGFFYLDLSDCATGQELQRASEQLRELSQAAFALPDEAKQAVAAAKMRSIFGYKGAGIVASADPHRRRDQGEFWNVSKDDIMAEHSSIPYPRMLMDAFPGVFRPFCANAHSVGMQVLRILAGHLGVPAEALLSRHRFGARSGDHTRLTYGPGTAEAPAAPPRDEADVRITTFAHTDFGSVTLLFNWLGGLQIENRGAGGAWEWVRPLPGHAICNLGDAMVEFSGGRVASGRHRVVTPPGAQARPERYSVVYFVRPEDDVVLGDLTLPEAERHRPGDKTYTAREWIEARARALGNTVGDKK